MPSVPIEHFVVLMMENHSFDHLLGFATGDLNGMPVTDDAADSTPSPGHQIANVNMQLFGTEDPGPDQEPTMDGFLTDYEHLTPAPDCGDAAHCEVTAAPTRCFAADSPSTQALRTLATSFALFTRWFSSVPGPTTPNRLFANCASSGGFAGAGYLSGGDSTPDQYHVPTSLCGLPSIFGRLSGQGTTWAAYHEQCNFVTEAVLQDASAKQIKYDPGFHTLESDVTSGQLPAYSFLTPSLERDSQHPSLSVQLGDSLIAWVYDLLFCASGPVSYRDNAALLVVYDEHGGYYDHVPPPSGMPYDGPVWAQLPDLGFDFVPPAFDFTRWGLRVPAVLISAYTPAGPDATVYEHSSIVHTTRDLFGITNPLTVRDLHAASLYGQFSLPLARMDLPDLSDVAKLWKANRPA